MRIVYEIPDEEKSRAINVICRKFNYQPAVVVQDESEIGYHIIDNPEGRQAFFKRMIGEMIRDWITNDERDEARQTIKQEAEQARQAILQAEDATVNAITPITIVEPAGVP